MFYNEKSSVLPTVKTSRNKQRDYTNIYVAECGLYSLNKFSRITFSI